MTRKILLIIAVFIGFFSAGVAIPRYILGKAVTVTPVVAGKAVDAIYATGTVEPSIRVPIAPKSAGHIVEITAEEGQSVKKGDVLVRLEDADLQASVSELKARLAFAESDLNRKKKLFDAKSVSRNVVETAQADYDALSAQSDKAKAQVSYMTLVAPADGVIIKRDGEIGQMAAAAQPIFYMSCCAPLRISAEVDEEDIPHVKVGQKVLIQSDAFPEKVYEGKVAAMTPMGDSVARSYRVRISYDNASSPLMIGMTTETNIIVAEKEKALLIPLSAVGKDNKVHVVKDGTVKIVTVQTGIRGADKVEVTDGLSEGDNVIVPSPGDELPAGRKVRPSRQTDIVTESRAP